MSTSKPEWQYSDEEGEQAWFDDTLYSCRKHVDQDGNDVWTVQVGHDFYEGERRSGHLTITRKGRTKAEAQDKVLVCLRPLASDLVTFIETFSDPEGDE